MDDYQTLMESLQGLSLNISRVLTWNISKGRCSHGFSERLFATIQNRLLHEYFSNPRKTVNDNKGQKLTRYAGKEAQRRLKEHN